MRRLSLPLAALLCAQTAFATSMAAPPESANEAQTLLAGGWRYEPDGGVPPACDQGPSEFGEVITFEFAVTGGRAQWTNPNGEGMNLGIEASRDGRTVALISPDGPSLKFELNDDGTLSGLEMAEFASDLTGKQFRKCYEPADRANIDGSAKALEFFGGGAEAAPVRFVDTRFAKTGKDLCLEPESQYLRLDMVGPLGFELNRWNSAAIAEKLAVDEKAEFPLDDLADYTLDALIPTGLGWEATITELIPPNGSRGDTSTIRLQVKGDHVTIPEWQRDYLRCTTGHETTIVAQ
ncbi:MAG: hypothetical protein QM698_10325 [Micropepsaceae bacterium]